MALAPRLSLRSLVLLMSHRKPLLSSFFSSPCYVPPTPAVDPPAAPAVPVLPDPGHPEQSIPDGGSYSSIPEGATPVPPPPTITPDNEQVVHQVLDPPRRPPPV